jgi:hypothetical protein
MGDVSRGGTNGDIVGDGPIVAVDANDCKRKSDRLADILREPAR